MSIEGFKQKNGYEIDGMWLPRVTAITSVVSKYPLFLKERGYFNEAAKWGHFVHKMFGNLARHERFEETETKNNKLRCKYDVLENAYEVGQFPRSIIPHSGTDRNLRDPYQIPAYSTRFRNTSLRIPPEYLQKEKQYSCTEITVYRIRTTPG